MKLFAKILLVVCLLSGVAYAADKIIFFTAKDTPSTNEKAAITTLSQQAAAPYRVVVRSERRARLRSHLESADYVAGAIPPNYRDGGIDSGTALYTVYNYGDPPDPATLVDTQAILRDGDTLTLAGGGSVTVTVSGNTVTVSELVLPDAGS